MAKNKAVWSLIVQTFDNHSVLKSTVQTEQYRVHREIKYTEEAVGLWETWS